MSPNYDVAVDVDGDVAAIWREVNSGVYELWVRIYDASTGVWGDREEATSDNTGETQGHRIEYDRASGEPMVAYLTPVSARRNAYFTRRGSTGWSPRMLLENHDADHLNTSMDFVANDVGQALFTYSIDVGGTTPTFYTLPYDNGDFRRDGSNALDALSFTTDTIFSGFPETDLSNSGDAMILIDDSIATERELLGVTVDVDLGSIGSPVVVHEGQSPTTFGPGDTAINDSGIAVATWGQTEQIGGQQPRPWASIYNGTWSTPREVGTLSVSTFGVKTDIDNNGIATVVWASGFNGVVATRNTGPGGAFLPEQEISGTIIAGGPIQVIAHDSGDFLTVWQESVDIRAVRCR